MKSKMISVLVLAASLVIGLHALARTLRLSWGSAEYSYILLILPVSVALLLAEQRRWWALREHSVGAGMVLMLVAGLLFGAVQIWSASIASDIQLACEMISVVLLWIGIFIVFFGMRAAKSNIFPLVLLFGLAPLPRSVLDMIVGLLQSGSAWTAHALFALLGVPVLQHGVQLTIPGLVIDISEECSSIRSSSLLVVAAFVLAQVLLSTSWRKALLIAISIPLTVVKNGMRIVTIAMLGTRIDPDYLQGRLHHQGGILFFAFALSVLCAAIWILRRGDSMGAEGSSAQTGLKLADGGRTVGTASRESQAAVL